jgi:hypothetical protein
MPMADYAISRDNDFTCEFIGQQGGGFRFRLCIDTDNPERFARFRQALEITEKILRMPHWRRDEQTERDITFAYEWEGTP